MRRDGNEGEKGEQCWRRGPFGDQRWVPKSSAARGEAHMKMSGSTRERAEGRKVAPPTG